MAQAPVVIFIENTLEEALFKALTPEERIAKKLQSIINMLLAAMQKGIGNLWIGDIFFACPKLRE